MTGSVFRYATSVAAAGGFLLALALADWRSSDLSRFLGYLLMAPVASMLKVRIPGIQGTVSPGFGVLLAAVMELGWQETVLLAALCGAAQCLSAASKRPTGLQFAFNSACMAISASIAYQLAHTAIAGGAPDAKIARVAIATPALFAANTILVAILVGLLKGQRPLDTWRRIHAWTFPHYVIGAAMTAGLWYASHLSGLGLPWLLLPVLYLHHAHQRESISHATVRPSP